MKKTLLKFSFVLGLAGILTSCELEGLDITGDSGDFKTTSMAKEIVEENAETELAVVKVFENVNNYGISEEGKKSAFIVDTVGPEITWDDLTMTMDFTGVDQAKGKIVVVFNQLPIYAIGLTAGITFDGYENEGTALAGEITLAIESMPAASIKFTMKSTGFLTITSSSDSYDWSCDQSILWSEGFPTLTDDTDDSFVLDGKSVQQTDSVVNETVIVGLVMDAGCEYNPTGVLTITADKGGSQEFVVSIDFGIGEDYDTTTGEGTRDECDDWVLLNAEGIVENLKLKFSGL